MRQVFFILLSFFMCLVFALPAMARVRASVDRLETGPGESVRLTVSVKGGAANVDTSAIRDFKIVSARTSSSIQISGQNYERKTEYIYTLLPLITGKAIIPSLEVNVDGKTFATKEITVRVSEEKQTKNQRQKSSDIFIEARVSDRQPYTGENITCIFQLYRGNVSTRNEKFFPPQFTGFSVKDLGKWESFSRIRDGRRYLVFEKKYLLTPLESGKKEIEPAKFSCDIISQSRKSNRNRSLLDQFFNDRFFKEMRPAQFLTPEITIEVHPLPPYHSDASFSGLVGEFDILTGIDSRTLRIGDTATLSVTISGRGNLPDAQMPEINIPREFKTYMDKPEKQVTAGIKGYEGNITFRRALVPVKEGEYAIGPVRLVYFNPEEKAYRSLSASPIHLRILPPKIKEQTTVYTPSENNISSPKQKVKMKGSDILPVKDNLNAIKSQAPLSFPVFLAGLLVPFFFFSGVYVFVKMIGKENDPSSIMAKRAEKELEKAAANIGEEDLFAGNLYRALISGIFSRAKSRGEILTGREAEKLLTGHGIDEKTAKETAGLLDEIEAVKFGNRNMEPEEKQNLLNKTRQTIRKIIG